MHLPLVEHADLHVAQLAMPLSGGTTENHSQYRFWHHDVRHVSRTVEPVRASCRLMQRSTVVFTTTVMQADSNCSSNWICKNRGQLHVEALATQRRQPHVRLFCIPPVSVYMSKRSFEIPVSTKRASRCRQAPVPGCIRPGGRASQTLLR